MPRCGACGKNYDDTSVLELVRNQDVRWISICRTCRDSGVDVNLVEKDNIAVEEAALAAVDHPTIDVTLTGDSLADARNLLEALRNLRQRKERVGRTRGHERRPVELTVHFTLARDDTRHEALVRDFSLGGLRVVTTYPLAVGQIVQFDWNVPLPPAMMRMLQSSAEARRVTRNPDGTYEIGFRFMTRQSDKGENRRRYRRYKCDMIVYYQRQGSEFMSRGKVTDISQGGCQMRLDERLAEDEVFQVRLIGGGGSKGDLVGSMKVCRVIPRDVEYETGCAFDKMHMEAQASAPASKAQ